MHNSIIKIFLTFSIVGLGMVYALSRNLINPILLNSRTSKIEKIKSNSSTPFGKWKAVNFIVGDAPAALTQSEAESFLKTEITIMPSIVVFFKDSCKSPVYKAHKENTIQYLLNYYRQESAIGIKQDSIIVVSVSCSANPIYLSNNSPNFKYNILLINKNKFVLNYSGVFYYFEKINENCHNKTPINGDTVRCIYGGKCHSTGYVIQGTRAKGHVIHVKPVNKNVPVEQPGSENTKGG